MATGSSPNLSLLQRLDPTVQEILAVAPNAVLHQLHLHTLLWHKKNVQGSIFIVKRNAPERFQLIIMNSSNQENLVEHILGISEYVNRAPYLIYRNKDEMVRAIEFTKPETSMVVCKVLQRILSTYMRIPPKPTLPPSKSNVEELAVNPVSEFKDGETNNSSSDEMSFLDSVLSQERTAVTASEVEQIVSSLPGTQQLPSADHLPLSSATFGNHIQNHMRPLDFPYRPPRSFVFDPLSNSSSPSTHLTPSTVASVMVSSECGGCSLTPILPHSVVPSSVNAPTIIREQLREDLARLVMDDSFVDMIFEEILKRHLR